MRLTDEQVIAARDYGRKTGDFTEEALATEVLESRAEIARMRNALSIWDKAISTARNEPLVAAWEDTRAAIGRDAT